jgi:hypothetical protein
MIRLDGERLRTFADLLRSHNGKRIPETAFWGAFDRAFPQRPMGREEQEWMHAALSTLAAEGLIQLPPPRSRYWRRGTEPLLPLMITRIDAPVQRDESWRRDAWHPQLSWVSTLSRLSADQVHLLRQVHRGLVERWFEEPVPVHYRSLQLTGYEKRLEGHMGTSLFAPGRLSPDLLGFYTVVLPLGWERIRAGGRVVVFENKEPFIVARTVLQSLAEPPYDIVAYGGGRGFEQSVEHLCTIGCRITVLDYVGDLDQPGLDIAVRAAAVAARTGSLPPLQPAPGMHEMMLRSVAALGRPDGLLDEEVRRLLTVEDAHWLPLEVQSRVMGMVRAGRRIPEEVLGPREMHAVWGSGEILR